MSAPGRKVRLVSAARHIYDGRPIHIGQEFEATEKDAEDLIAMHFATLAPNNGTLHVKNSYRRRDMKAEE
jgi:hypothetical protein